MLQGVQLSKGNPQGLRNAVQTSRTRVNVVLCKLRRHAGRSVTMIIYRVTWGNKIADFQLEMKLFPQKAIRWGAICMYLLVLRRLFFWRTSFNPRVSVSSPPDRNDRTTLPITNRNPNIFTVIPSLRFSLPLT